MTQKFLEHRNRKRGDERVQRDKTPIITIASLRAALARLNYQFPPGFTACLDPSLRFLAAPSDQILVPRPIPRSSARQYYVFFLTDLLLLLHGLYHSWVGLSFLVICLRRFLAGHCIFSIILPACYTCIHLLFEGPNNGYHFRFSRNKRYAVA
jgi:hypothetical protein